MPDNSLTADELDFLKRGLNSQTKIVNIRLREGEYQFDLAKALAAHELKLILPDVRDLIRELYGEEKAEDVSFIRKIQTILKKMEKSGIVEILPKSKPWELQRYALSSFKFQDVEKNLVVLATETQAKETLEKTRSQPCLQNVAKHESSPLKPRILLLISVIVVSYAAVLWAVYQPTINTIALVIAFCIAAASSILLGTTISRKR